MGPRKVVRVNIRGFRETAYFVEKLIRAGCTAIDVLPYPGNCMKIIRAHFPKDTVQDFKAYSAVSNKDIVSMFLEIRRYL